MFQAHDISWRLPHRNETLGAYIRAARTSQGISQDAIVRETDLSLSSLRNIESGRTPNPGLFTLHQIWVTLNMPWKALGLVAKDSPTSSDASTKRTK